MSEEANERIPCPDVNGLVSDDVADLERLYRRVSNLEAVVCCLLELAKMSPEIKPYVDIAFDYAFKMTQEVHPNWDNETFTMPYLMNGMYWAVHCSNIDSRTQ